MSRVSRGHTREAGKSGQQVGRPASTLTGRLSQVVGVPNLA